MHTLSHHLRAFKSALQFLTLLPVQLAEVPDRRQQALAMLYYPAVGLLIGALLCTGAILSDGLPLELRATLLLLLWCGVTGGLHLDGLADSGDGWMGGLGDRERTLAIMKDPHIGASGVLVLLLQLLLKWSLLLALLPQTDWLALLLAPVAARTAALLLLVQTPYARPGGIAGEMLAELPSGAVYLLVAGVGLGLLLIQPLWLALPALVYLLARRAMLRRLGGCTGDTAGALIELSESALIFAAVLAHLATGSLALPPT
ncbi:adenosylcobinamide-GDP ribazoletransferase [Marinobacterium zhoushanense]|uniref:Adenosylcobinamide-GDP ribazoletransferase n=1 Tax=Marinobacterium zhoushanense TaxID=1679163 RepID=A0ABQ1KJN9_9GAMM|nr:adenosylcobinamide-GDP ribazoletransferase [Marinobacterium zhoushanense]GGB98118.1 adenosylcobinamide-GDP ribazoletransferase [Marinobacterium zhoushanense]